jgi:hypothetical protein
MDFANYYGRGNRETGHYYLVQNFNESIYSADKNGHAFTDVLLWDGNEEVLSLAPITYRTADNKPALQQPPTIYEEKWFDMKVILLCALGSLCAVSTLILIVWGVTHRSEKIVIAIQPQMCLIILLGGVFITGRVFEAALKISDATCISGIWLGHMGFVMAFGSLFTKMYRIDVIINSGMKRVKVSEKDVIKIVLVLILCMVVYLCILTWVGKPQRSGLCVTKHNQETCMMQCTLEMPGFHTALFTFEGLSLLYGGYLCYRIKGAPKAVNESKTIAQGLCSIISMCLYFCCCV